jgi:Xaa-Pro aminopeptidase
MPHGVSHHVGIDVHDAGTLDTLKTGMVITVEPGIYVPGTDTLLAPAYRGFGVRIEDDVLVTAGGSEVLSAGIPRDIQSVEKLVGKEKPELRSSSRTPR